MSMWFYVLLALVALLAAWLGWRYFRLRRALRRYAAELRADSLKASARSAEVESVSNVLRQILEENARHLSGVVADRDRLAAVLEQMADGVLIANTVGEIQFANPAATRIFAVSNMVGKTVTEALRDHRLVDAWRRCADKGAMQSELIETPASHQTLQLVVVPDAHGGGSLLLVQDLTRMRRLETVRQDFVANFSHELRTPLASLKALAETLQDGALHDASAASGFLQRIVAEVDSLTQMSQELLDLTSIESGKASLHIEPTAPRKLLDSAAERMRLQVQRANLQIHVDCPETLPAVNADAARLSQVLLNLIHNAVKFTPAGGQIRLSAQVDETPGSVQGCVLFAVSDNGLGISSDDLPRIFERLYRADRARTAAGTGMGLSIARHLVEAHGGRIWAESVEGGGSTFKFTIPQAPY